MRGRKPEVLRILLRTPPSGTDRSQDASPWYQVRRARIVLGIAAGQRREDLAAQFECDESTIWRTCQRYLDLGFTGLLADQRQGRSGRDLGITLRKGHRSLNWLAWNPWPRGCTSPTGRVMTWPAGRGGRHRCSYQPPVRANILSRR